MVGSSSHSRPCALFANNNYVFSFSASALAQNILLGRLSMGNTAATNDVERLTLGPCNANYRFLGELGMEDYWELSDSLRFFHVVWEVQPESKKGLELCFDVDLFIQEGPKTGGVLSA
jgi:hypothetical protein